MKKVVIRGVKHSEIVEVDRPGAIDGWCVVKIHSAPMCTEYKAWRDGSASEYLGHEAAGEIIEAGVNSGHQVGERVVVMPQFPCRRCALCLEGEYVHCRNTYRLEDVTGSAEGRATYAQYLIKPGWLLHNIPDGIVYDHAGMLCCGLGPTYGAMTRMNVGAADTVLISGMGPVGLGGVINGVYRNARVIVTANSPYRAKLARSLGAFAVIDPAAGALDAILELTAGIGVDKSIECAGTSTAQRLCIDATRRNGHVAFVGESGELSIHVSDDMIRKGLSLHGIWHYNLNDIQRLFQIVNRYPHLISKLVTHTFPLEEVKAAWELQLSRQCGKVVLHPW